MLFRYLLTFINASGRLASHGGLNSPPVYASSPEQARDQAVKDAPPFVNSNLVSAEVVTMERDRPGGSLVVTSHHKWFAEDHPKGRRWGVGF